MPTANLVAIVRYLLPGFTLVSLSAVKHFPNSVNSLDAPMLSSILIGGLIVGMILDTFQRLCLGIVVGLAKKSSVVNSLARRYFTLIPLSWGYFNLLPLRFGLDYIAIYAVWANLREPAFSYLRSRDDIANFMIKVTFVLFLFSLGELLYHIVIWSVTPTDVVFIVSSITFTTLFYFMAVMRLKIAIGITFLITEIYLHKLLPENLARAFPAGLIWRLEQLIMSRFQNLNV